MTHIGKPWSFTPRSTKCWRSGAKTAGFTSAMTATAAHLLAALGIPFRLEASYWKEHEGVIARVGDVDCDQLDLRRNAPETRRLSYKLIGHLFVRASPVFPTANRSTSKRSRARQAPRRPRRSRSRRPRSPRRRIPRARGIEPGCPYGIS